MISYPIAQKSFLSRITNSSLDTNAQTRQGKVLKLTNFAATQVQSQSSDTDHIIDHDDSNARDFTHHESITAASEQMTRSARDARNDDLQPDAGDYDEEQAQLDQQLKSEFNAYIARELGQQSYYQNNTTVAKHRDQAKHPNPFQEPIQSHPRTSVEETFKYVNSCAKSGTDHDGESVAYEADEDAGLTTEKKQRKSKHKQKGQSKAEQRKSNPVKDKQARKEEGKKHKTHTSRE